MRLNIIHLVHRTDRKENLLQEIANQCITNYRLWDGIITEEGKRGIALAHKQVVRDALINELPYVIIAEDDIKFTALNGYHCFHEHIPNEFDLYLGGVMYGKVYADNSVNRFAGLTLYAIHQKFYKTFLELSDDTHLDQALDHKGKYIVCNPFVVTQYDGYSDNHKKRMEYKYYVKHYHFLKNT